MVAIINLILHHMQCFMHLDGAGMLSHAPSLSDTSVLIGLSARDSLPSCVCDSLIIEPVHP